MATPFDVDKRVTVFLYTIDQMLGGLMVIGGGDHTAADDAYFDTALLGLRHGLSLHSKNHIGRQEEGRHNARNVG